MPAGGSLHRPSRLLLGAGASASPSQDPSSHTLPPLSPGSHTAAHAGHRMTAGSNGGRGAASGTGISARLDGASAVSRRVITTVQPRTRIGPAISGSATGPCSGSAVAGLSVMSMERRHAQAAETTTAVDRTRRIPAMAVTATITAGGTSSVVKGSRPLVWLGRGGALAPGTSTRGRAKGPVAGVAWIGNGPGYRPQNFGCGDG